MKLIPLLSIFFFFISLPSISKETWILDNSISNIDFELPIFLANNVKGTFKNIEGLVEINLNTKKNKAIFFVDLSSIEINYDKYKNLLLSNVFFNTLKFPKAVIDTKKFSYKNENLINLDVELSIKGVTNSVPLSLEVISLTEELIQIKGKVKFSRTKFQIGTGKWSNTSILKDRVNIDINLFFLKNKTT